MILRDALDRALSWHSTGRAECPYAARVDGRDWLIRVNDFPAEALYTLIIDGREAGGFDDWPERWTRPD